MGETGGIREPPVIFKMCKCNERRKEPMFDYSGSFGIGDWNVTIGDGTGGNTYYPGTNIPLPGGGAIVYTPATQNNQNQQMLWLLVIVLAAVVVLKK
jgi:hypothetical protein